jgi:serine phosphatase RsbU (regulator of sigma subunit)
LKASAKKVKKMALMVYLPKLICRKKTVEYAAANNAPILIRGGQIIEMPTDKMPVGHGEKTDSFKVNNIQLQTGDRIYFYTDGYADQFGGPQW